MTERTIRSLAKELAGAFYEGTRTGRFRADDAMCRARRLHKHANGLVEEVVVQVPFHEAYPTVHHYVKAHWPYFYDLARKQMTQMLAMPSVHPNVKAAIFEALKEDNEKQLTEQAKRKDIPDLIGQRTAI